MAYRFLRKDYDALLAKIEELAAALREAGQEKGRWANQGAETWHDNFGYEEGQRQECRSGRSRTASRISST